MRGQPGDLPPQTHSPLPGRLPRLLLLLLAVRGLQQHRHLAVLPTVLLAVADLPAQGPVRTAGGDGGVVEGGGVVRVRLAVLVVVVMRLQPVGCVPGGLAEGALTRVAVLPPRGGVRGEEGAAGVSAVSARLVLDRPVSSTVLPPHRAAGPALETHRVTAVHSVSEADSLRVVSEGERGGQSLEHLLRVQNLKEHFTQTFSHYRFTRESWIQFHS